MPDALGALVETAQLIGDNTGEVDPEQIATLAPDLILHNTSYGGLDPAVVQRIAPTLSFEYLSGGYEENLRRLAGWLGRDAAADAAADGWNDRLATLAGELSLAGATFTLVSPNDASDAFNLFGPDVEIGRVVTALGGTIVPEQVGGTPLTVGTEYLSPELLPDLVTGDTVVLLRPYGSGRDEAIAEFTANPLWRAVDAVTRGDVIVVDVQDAGSHGYVGLERAARTIADGLTPNR